MIRREREAGAALLTVLLMVAVISALAMLALDKLRIATAIAANGAGIEQARAFMIGGEAVATARVQKLAEAARTQGGTMAGWQNRPYPIPVPGGRMIARVIDGGNCFNLNSVAEGPQPDTLARRPLGVTQFAALMRLLDIPDQDAQAIASATADWIDSDSVPGPSGAEDDAYLRLDPSYRTANTLMADVSELRAVRGVTPDIYARLRPWLCALPTAELAPINPNTLTPDQAPLVAMLAPGQLDVERARAMIAARPANGFPTAEAFWQQAALEGIVGESMQQLDLRTRWFALRLDAEVGGAQVRETALIDAGLSPARVVMRSWGDDE